MPSIVSIESFLELANDLPLIDVRAPIEFAGGHIPGAINMPLFDDKQREEIGTIYKRQGRQKAVIKGLEYAGQKMHLMATAALKRARKSQPNEPPENELRKILVHCWRGGMRSQSVSWLFEQADLDVTLLEGGYKSFRRHVLDSFEKPVNLIVLSGLTGAGKTRQLMRLRDQGEQVLDLEGLANHRGSALGGICQPEQPRVEQFENDIFTALSKMDLEQRVWVEDESRRIGTVTIPEGLFTQMRSAAAVFMDVNADERRRLALEDYGELPRDELIAAVQRITKRLGPQNAKAAIEAIEASEMNRCAEILLDYYDRTYNVSKSRNPREVTTEVDIENPDSVAASQLIIAAAEKLQIQGK